METFNNKIEYSIDFNFNVAKNEKYPNYKIFIITEIDDKNKNEFDVL